VPFYRAQDLFQQADIFLNPGDTDSIDKTGLEAMSCGLPIVTSNIAFKEVLPTDMQGISIVPKDDPAAFAETIATIAGWTPEVRRAFGLRGRDTVIADHSIDSLADKLMASMRLLTAKKNNRDASNAG
jgi:glycosyltransferase involved in cell wall biosynthesis